MNEPKDKNLTENEIVSLLTDMDDAISEISQELGIDISANVDRD